MAQAENSSSKVFAQPLAFGLGVALLLGFAFLTGFQIYEKSHRASIEHADASNGVGDKTFFPQSFNPAQPLLNFEGRSLYFADHKNLADTVMVRVGMDDANTYAVYKLAGAKDQEASFVYLKMAPNYYLKAKR